MKLSNTEHRSSNSFAFQQVQKWVENAVILFMIITKGKLVEELLGLVLSASMHVHNALFDLAPQSCKENIYNII